MSRFLPKRKSPHVHYGHLLLLAGLALFGLARADIYHSLDPETPRKYSNVLPTEGRWELYLKEKPLPVAQAAASEVPSVPLDNTNSADSSARYARQIEAAALANNVEAALIRAVIAVESGYNPSAVSKAGAVGLMQLMPGVAKRYKVKNRHDPTQNIHGGTQYLRDLLIMFDNNLSLALAAYNAGEQAVMRHGNRIPPYRETRAYVPKVMKFYSLYSAASVAAADRSSISIASAANLPALLGRISWTYSRANLPKPEAPEVATSKPG